jgi:nitroreductase
MVRDLIIKNRSYRRFFQDEPVSLETLRELVDLARLSPSARNAQPLRFVLSNEPEKNAVIFKHLAWAGSLKDWPGPEEGERPAAYIIILCDREISPTFGCDHGIASQSILLGAAEKGLGGCNIGSIQRPSLQSFLKIPSKYEILLVLALGKPKETVVIEAVGPDGDTKYYRDEAQVHHVPKRSLADLILS